MGTLLYRGLRIGDVVICTIFSPPLEISPIRVSCWFCPRSFDQLLYFGRCILRYCSPETKAARRAKCSCSGCSSDVLFGRISMSDLGGKSKSIITISWNMWYQNWLGQSGTIKMPVALSLMIFCNTLSIQLNGGKHKNVYCSMTLWRHQWLQLLVLADRQRIYPVVCWFWIDANRSQQGRKKSDQ